MPLILIHTQLFPNLVVINLVDAACVMRCNFLKGDVDLLHCALVGQSSSRLVI